MLITFAVVVLGWIIFRAETITQAWDFILSIGMQGIFTLPYYHGRMYMCTLVVGILIMLLIEWINRDGDHGLAITKRHRMLWTRHIVYMFLILYIFYFGNFGYNQFIYFQF